MLVCLNYGHTEESIVAVLALVCVESGRVLWALVEELSTTVAYLLV